MKKICNYCHVAFDEKLEKCPICKRSVQENSDINKKEYREGLGRKYGVGGEACDYCPHCYGNENWCPYMD